MISYQHGLCGIREYCSQQLPFTQKENASRFLFFRYTPPNSTRLPTASKFAFTHTQTKKKLAYSQFFLGAGYENRTRTLCLGSIHTTTILIPLALIGPPMESVSWGEEELQD